MMMELRLRWKPLSQVTKITLVFTKISVVVFHEG